MRLDGGLLGPIERRAVHQVRRAMRDLAPYLVFLIDRQNKSRRQDRNPPIGRQNLEWILNGHPEAVPLFSLDASSSGVLRSSSN